MNCLSPRRILLGLCALAFGSGSAGAITLDAPPFNNVAIEAGATTEMALVFRNDEHVASDDYEFVISTPVEGYSMEMASAPGCGPFHPYPPRGIWSASTIGALGPGESRTCMLRIARAPTAIHNGFFNGMLAGTSTWISVTVGTFVDIALSARQEAANLDPDGTLHAIVRLQASNTSALAVDGVVMGLGLVCTGNVIAVDMDLPGGCASVQVDCGAPAARFPVVTAGGTQSCLARFTVPTGVDPTVQAFRAGELRNAATGGWIVDSNAANDEPVIALSAQGAAIAQAAPALSPSAVILLALLSAAVAAIAMARRDREFG